MTKASANPARESAIAIILPKLRRPPSQPRGLGALVNAVSHPAIRFAPQVTPCGHAVGRAILGVLPVTRPSRSLASRSIDNFLGGFFLHKCFAPSGRTAIKPTFSGNGGIGELQLPKGEHKRLLVGEHVACKRASSRQTLRSGRAPAPQPHRPEYCQLHPRRRPGRLKTTGYRPKTNSIDAVDVFLSSGACGMTLFGCREPTSTATYCLPFTA
jgi:hypothetical protein